MYSDGASDIYLHAVPIPLTFFVAGAISGKLLAFLNFACRNDRFVERFFFTNEISLEFTL